ncbi:MAG: hypothetical protein HXY41_13645 [Chloroflexi bacterium]|nr:hypothetical protein [Chloroflexota bacterium]
MRKRAGILLACLLLIGVGGTVPAAAQERAPWTWMVYLVADNDLEPFAINDLIEMQAGAGENVNIVIQMDRAESYEEVFGDWTETRRYAITPGAGGSDFAVSRETIQALFASLTPDDLGLSSAEFDDLLNQVRSASDSEIEALALQSIATPGGGAPLAAPRLAALENLGEVNSGDPQVLVDFITWAAANYPAEHYGLILWDHGGGWTMVGSDEQDGDLLEMPEIEAALEAATVQAGIERFDFVAFDACLMAQLEVFEMLARFADYAIASEETIPGAGWEYTTPLRTLNQNPDMDTAELGRIIVDSYMTFYTDVITSYPNFDLALLDLSQVGGVVDSITALASAVAANPQDSLAAIGQARNNAQVFGADSSPDEADAISSVDLIHVMNLLAELSPDPAVAEAAQGVSDTTAAMVVYSRTSDGLPDASGVSIFFPRNARTYELSGGAGLYRASNPASLLPWYDFLDTFHGTATTTLDAAALNISITGLLPADAPGSIYDPPVILFDLNGQQIVDVSFFVTLQLDDGTQYMLDTDQLVSSTVTVDGEAITGYPDGLSSWEFTWNVEMPVVSDGEVEIPTLLLPSDQENQAIVSGFYLWKDGRSATAYLVFDTENRVVTGVWGVEQSGTATAPAEIRVSPGDRFQPTWRFLDENNEVVLVGTDDVLTFGGAPFTFRYVPAQSGDYALTILIEDLAGNISADTANLSVDNEGLDTAYRGFKDVSFGINFLYPWNWTDPTVFEDEEGGVTLNVSDESGDINIYIEAYEVESADAVLDLKLEEFSGLDDLEYSEPRAVDLDGYDAYYVDYRFTTGGEAREGWLAVVYVPENGLGYSLDLDAPPDLLEAADAAFLTMLDSLIFFEPYAGE